MATSIGAVSRGYGFAWLPEYKILTELAQGVLKRLPMGEDTERIVHLYLVFADRDAAGPGTLRLAQMLKEEVTRNCQLGGATEGAEVGRRPGEGARSAPLIAPSTHHQS
jgi:DNA-binding transcriptional LysR family regulator